MTPEPAQRHRWVDIFRDAVDSPPTSYPQTMSDNPTQPSPEYRVSASLATFGSDPVAVQAWVLPRSDRWRIVGALRAGLLGIVTAPVVFLVPPHVPWALAALATGTFLAYRRMQERFTLLWLEGVCPRCGTTISVARPTRLRGNHTLPCPGCQHETVLSVDTPTAIPAGT